MAEFRPLQRHPEHHPEPPDAQIKTAPHKEAPVFILIAGVGFEPTTFARIIKAETDD
jgi:hypothetical protein